MKRTARGEESYCRYVWSHVLNSLPFLLGRPKNYRHLTMTGEKRQSSSDILVLRIDLLFNRQLTLFQDLKRGWVFLEPSQSNDQVRLQHFATILWERMPIWGRRNVHGKTTTRDIDASKES